MLRPCNSCSFQMLDAVLSIYISNVTIFLWIIQKKLVQRLLQNWIMAGFLSDPRLSRGQFNSISVQFTLPVVIKVNIIMLRRDIWTFNDDHPLCIMEVREKRGELRFLIITLCYLLLPGTWYHSGLPAVRQYNCLRLDQNHSFVDPESVTTIHERNGKSIGFYHLIRIQSHFSFC